MEPTKQCIFFAGGKRFNFETSDDKGVLKISKDKTGKVLIELKMELSSMEATSAIFNFSELSEINGDEKLIPEKYKNMLYLEAYQDEVLTPKEISIGLANLSIGFDKGQTSIITINASVENSGKTDHPKTDHANTGTGGNNQP
jgi:hypothetical protein